MNMFLVYEILGLQPSEVQVMLFDRFADGPYLELIRRAFSPDHPVLRHTHYRGKVLFRRLVFHLESPAGLIFPKVSRPGPLRCRRTGLFDSYRRFVLQSFDLLQVDPPAIPSVTLTLRHRTPEKNVGRVMANEQEVIQVLRSGNMIDVQVVDTAAMKFSEQLKLIRSTNVLIGIHGAGLMLIMFAAEEAVLVEVYPSYRQDRHFRHAARMTGKVYMPLRASSRETCRGSSDSVTVPIDEFRAVVDGAVRIARSVGPLHSCLHTPSLPPSPPPLTMSCLLHADPSTAGCLNAACGVRVACWRWTTAWTRTTRGCTRTKGGPSTPTSHADAILSHTHAIAASR